MARNQGAPQKAAAPTYRTKRVVLPAGRGYSVGSFVVRELDGADELEIAMSVDTRMTSAMGGMLALMELKQQEAHRRALVEVDGKPVDIDGVGYVELDRWNQRTRTMLARAFNALNAVDGDDLKAVDAQLDGAPGQPEAIQAIALADDDEEDEPGETPTGG